MPAGGPPATKAITVRPNFPPRAAPSPWQANHSHHYSTTLSTVIVATSGINISTTLSTVIVGARDINISTALSTVDLARVRQPSIYPPRSAPSSSRAFDSIVDLARVRQPSIYPPPSAPSSSRAPDSHQYIQHSQHRRPRGRPTAINISTCLLYTSDAADE